MGLAGGGSLFMEFRGAESSAGIAGDHLPRHLETQIYKRIVQPKIRKGQRARRGLT